MPDDTNDIDKRLEEIRERERKATAGPWEAQTSNSWQRIGSRGRDGNVLCPSVHPRDRHPDLIIAEHDLSFILHARVDIPFLLRELAAWRQAVEEHNNTPGWKGTGVIELTVQSIIARQRQLAAEGQETTNENRQ